MAFSINLEKQFIIVPRNEFNSRIESLLQLVGLQDRMVSDEQAAMEAAGRKIVYTPVRDLLDKERQRAAEFIRTSFY